MSRISASAREGDVSQTTLQKLGKAAAIQVVKIKIKIKIKDKESRAVRARCDASEGGK